MKDLQDFITIAIGIVRFFYRRCIPIDNKVFIDAVIESITYILFTTNDAAIYNLLMMLYKMQDFQ